METRDREITCVECGVVFMFSIGEQEFYRRKEFTDPKRCKGCRRVRKEKKRREEGLDFT